jgi:hypothetical protein
MVHALHEAYRVLKVGGRLIDLEPADRDRKALARPGGAWHAIGKIFVDYADVRSAGRALTQVVEQGIYRKVSSRAFRIRQYFRTRRDWREYLGGLTVSKPEPGLVQKIDAMFKSHPDDTQIAVEFDLMLRVLKKNEQPRR